MSPLANSVPRPSLGISLVLLLLIVGIGVFLVVKEPTATSLIVFETSQEAPLLHSWSTSGGVPLTWNTAPTSLAISGRLLGTGSVKVTWKTTNAEHVVWEKVGLGTGASEFPAPPLSTISDGTMDLTIGTQLTYAAGTPWDVHDNGVEPSGKVIDLSLGTTTFSTTVDSAYLCTRWTVVNSAGNIAETCTGNDACCGFLGTVTEPASSWDALQIYDGRYGADARSIITAQPVFYHVNLDLENLSTDIAYGSSASLPVQWVDTGDVTTLDTRCMDSCRLQDTSSAGKLVVNIAGDATLELTSVTASFQQTVRPTWNGPAKLKITSNGSIQDLNDWWTAPSGTSLSYTVDGSVNLDVSVDGSLLTLIPSTGFKGEREITITAHDGTTSTSHTLPVIVGGKPTIAFHGQKGRQISSVLTESGDSSLQLSTSRIEKTKTAPGTFGITSEQVISNNVLLTGMTGDGIIEGYLDTYDAGVDESLIAQKLSTDIVAFPEDMTIASAEIALQKTGTVTTIVECPAFDVVTGSCPEWLRSDVPFVENATHITFTVTHFSGYGGANIAVINVQSYPTVGGNWTVRFNTTGTANLTITAYDGTSFTEWPTDDASTVDDLEFLELACGGVPLTASRVMDGTRTLAVTYPDYTCAEEGTETSRVLTAGKHHLMFTFGDSNASAHNDASLDSCANITTEGNYELSQNVTGAGTCMRINVSNVVLDCMGYTMIYGNESTGYAFDISATDATIHNVTVRNCNILNGTSGTSGIEIRHSQNITVFNVTLNVSTYGIYATNTTGTNITANRIVARKPGTYVIGVYLENSNNATVQFNTIETFTRGYGISLYNTNDTTIYNNTAVTRGTDNDMDAIVLDAISSRNTITDNTAWSLSSGIGTDGITITQSDGNAVRRNRIVVAGSVSTGGWGIVIIGGSNNFSDNNITLLNASSRGIWIARNPVGNNTFVNTRINASHASSIEYYLEVESEASDEHTTEFVNLTLTRSNLTFHVLAKDSTYLHGLLQNEVVQTSPTGKYSIGKYFNATNGTGSPWMIVNITYADAEIATAGITDENSLRIWRYNTSASAWQNHTFAGAYGVDTTNNFVYANISTFSTFGVFGDDPNAFSACTNITTSGSYTLAQNVTAAGTCIQINVSNVVLDCRGYQILYGNASKGLGINVSLATNVTVKNCIIAKGINYSAENHGISIYNVQNSSISNNNIRTNGSSNNIGILIDFIDGNGFPSKNININNNTVYPGGNSTSNDGIQVRGSNLTIRENTIISLSGIGPYGIDSDSVNESVILGNTIVIQSITGSISGIWIGTGQNLSFVNNNITVSGTSNIYGLTLDCITCYDFFVGNNTITTISNSSSVWGIFATAEPTIFENNTVVVQGIDNTKGVEIDGMNSRITRNSITVTTGVFGNVADDDNDGIYVFTEAGTQIIANNTITATGSEGNGIYFAQGNYIVQGNTVTITTQNSSGIKFDDASSTFNLFSDNRINVTHDSSLESYDNIGSWSSLQNITLVRGNISLDVGGPSGGGYHKIHAGIPAAIRSGILPGYYTIFKQINITRFSTPDHLSVNISYTDQDLSAAGITNESTLDVVHYNISTQSWEISDAESSVDANNNKLFLNYSNTMLPGGGVTDEGRIFGITAPIPGALVSCTNITASGNYLLVQNLTGAGTCMQINASDVVLDCRGYKILYGNSSQGVGINITQATNISVRNCIITKGANYSDSNYGIALDKVRNSTFTNNTLRTNGSDNNVGIIIGVSEGTIAASNNTNILINNNTIIIGGNTTSNDGIQALGTNITILANFIDITDTKSSYGLDINLANSSIMNNVIRSHSYPGGNGAVWALGTDMLIHHNTIDMYNKDGIYTEDIPHLSIYNNTISLIGNESGSYAIDVENGNSVDINITTNTIRLVGTSNLYLINLNGGPYDVKIINNTFEMNGTDNNYGISATQGSAINITGNQVMMRGTTDGRLLYLGDTAGADIFNNNFTFVGSSGSYGFDSTGLQSIDIGFNTFTLATNGTRIHGIQYSSSGISSIHNNTITVSGNNHLYGLYMENSDVISPTQFTLRQNNITIHQTNSTQSIQTPSKGIWMSDTNNNILQANTIIMNASNSSGIHLQMTGNLLDDNVIILLSNLSDGIALESISSSASNNVVTDTIINATIASSNEIRVLSMGGTDAINNSFLNITFSRTGALIDAVINNSVSLRSVLSAAVPYSTAGYFALGKYINVSQTGDFQTQPWLSLNVSYSAQELTTAGVTDESALQFRFYNTTTATWRTSEFTINSVDTTANKITGETQSFGLLGGFAVNAFELTACSAITVSGNYHLAANLSSTGTCLRVNASNVTIDCGRYTITTNSPSQSYGINVSRDDYGHLENITVKNCDMSAIGVSGGESYSYNIYMRNTSHTQVLNNTLRTNRTGYARSIVLDFSSQNSSIYNNSIQMNGSNMYAILVEDAINLRILNNTISSISSTGVATGIEVVSSNRTVVDNNQFSISSDLNSGTGIVLEESIDSAITNNVITTTTEGIILNSFSNTTNITDNNITVTRDSTDDNFGVTIEYGWGIQLLRNRLQVVGNLNTYGIYLFEGHYGMFSNNTFNITGSDDGTTGIFLKENIIGNHNNTINNNILYLQGLGIKGILSEASHGNNLTNNQLIISTGSNTNYGIYSNVYTTNNRFENTSILMTGTSSTNKGIALNDAHTITISGLNVTVDCQGTSNEGLELIGVTGSTIRDSIFNVTGTSSRVISVETQSNSNTFTNVLVISKNVSGQGIVFDDDVNNNIIRDSTINTPFGDDIAVTSLNSEVTHLINVTFNQTNVSFTSSTSNAYLNVSWLIRGLTGASNQSTVANVGINASHSNGQVAWTNITDVTGYSSWVASTEYIQNYSGRFYKTPYIFNLSHPSFAARSVQQNFSASGTIELTLAGPNGLTSCQNITSSGNYQVLNAINASGLCININASNVVLDCLGYQITYGTAGTGRGISVAKDVQSAMNNVTIQNCVISKEMSGGDTQNYGIALTNLTNGTIRNNRIATNGTIANTGIIVVSAAAYLSIINNTITTNGSQSNNYGISFVKTSNSIVANNTISTDGILEENVALVIFSSSNNNRIESNRLYPGGSDTSIGVRVEENGINNSIVNNIIRTNGLTGGDNVGIYIFDGSNNTQIIGNNITTTGATDNNHGIHSITSSYGTLYENRIITTGRTSNNGIVLDTSSSNTITSNSINATGTTLVRGVSIITNSMNNTLRNNSISVLTNESQSGSVWVTTGSHNNQIINNSLWINGTTTGGGNRGIVIVEVADNTSIINNTVITDGPAGGNYGIELNFEGSVQLLNTLIRGNTIQTNSWPSAIEPENNGVHIEFANDTQILENTIVAGGNRSRAIATNGDITGLVIGGNRLTTAGLGTVGHGILFGGGDYRIIIENNSIATAGIQSHGVVTNAVTEITSMRWNNITLTGTSSNGFQIEETPHLLAMNNRVNATSSSNSEYTLVNGPATPLNVTFINLTSTRTNTMFQIKATDDVMLKSFLPTENGYGNITGKISMGRFFNTSSVQGGALINLSYITEDAVSITDESTVRIWYYNTTTATWQNTNFYQGTNGVDTSNNMVYANITASGFFGVFGDDPTLLTACSNITASGSYAVLQNLSSTGTCIRINASNVVVNCNAYSITTGGSSNAQHIIVNSSNTLNNITIRGCTLLHTNGADNSITGIRASTVTNLTLESITATFTANDTVQGFHLSATTMATITNSSVTINSGWSDSRGVTLDTNTVNVSISNASFRITGNGSRYAGVLVNISNNNSIASSTIFTNQSDNPTEGTGTQGMTALHLLNSNRTIVTRSSLTSDDSAGDHYAIYLEGYAKNNFFGDNSLTAYHRIMDTTTIGIFVTSNADDTSIINNQITMSSIDWVTSIRAESDRNSIQNNTITTTTTTGTEGIYLTWPDNNTITGNNIQVTTPSTDAKYGFYLTDFAYGNIFANNSITLRGSAYLYGVYLSSFRMNSTFISNNITLQGNEVYGIYADASGGGYDPSDVMMFEQTRINLTGNRTILFESGNPDAQRNEIMFRNITIVATNRDITATVTKGIALKQVNATAAPAASAYWSQLFLMNTTNTDEVQLPSVYLTVHYTDAELSAMDAGENLSIVARYNRTTNAWRTDDVYQATSFVVNTTQNTITANITAFGLIGVFARTDADADNQPDDNDTLIGTVNDITLSGVTNPNITIDGQSILGSFQGVNNLLFNDGTVQLVNFTHNFTAQRINFSQIAIRVNSSGIVFHATGDPLNASSKQLFMNDSSWTDLCAKDATVSSLNDISAACTGSNETDLSSCIGGNLTSGNITCVDLGTRLRVGGLRHSGIEASITVAEEETPAATGGSSGGGGGGSSRTILVYTNLSHPMLDMILPPLISIDNVSKQSYIILFNRGSIPLSNIEITTRSSTPNVTVTVDDIHERIIQPSEQVSVRMTLTAQRYFDSRATISIRARDDVNNVTANGVITVEAPVVAAIRDAQELIRLGNQVIMEHAECLEFRELIERARTELAKGNAQLARDFAQAALQGCQTYLSKQNPARERVKLPQRTIDMATVLIVLALAILLMVLFAHHQSRSFKPSVIKTSTRHVAAQPHRFSRKTFLFAGATLLAVSAGVYFRSSLATLLTYTPAITSVASKGMTIPWIPIAAIGGTIAIIGAIILLWRHKKATPSYGKFNIDKELSDINAMLKS